jgi:hypothetical protein
MYGRPAGRPLTETRDYAAHTTKGKLRAKMATELLAAHQADRVAVAIGRASDYFGPRGGAQSNLGDRLFHAALAGKTASVLGDPDQPHLHLHPGHRRRPRRARRTPRCARAGVASANDPYTRTTRQLCELAFQQAGASPVRLRQVPPLLLRLAALTNPTVRELLEVQYQFGRAVHRR